MSLGEDKIREIYGWLPVEAIDLFVNSYLETEDSTAAWAVVRSDTRYETWFPGNLTDDGRVRYSEAVYGRTIAEYDEVFMNVGIDPSVFRDRYGEFIAGDVTPQELELNRVNPMFDRVLSRSEALKEIYANYFNVEFTDSALLASALDPDLGERILTQQITIAEIGGAAAVREFDVSRQFASMLSERGMDQDRANAVFGSARALLPILDVLARRHSDPDETFDLEEFVGGVELDDEEQRRRMDRLAAQEGSLFTGGKQISYSQGKTGGLGGLEVL